VIWKYRRLCSVCIEPWIQEEIIAIEINPRVSRSSGQVRQQVIQLLRSAAKLAIGYNLDELKTKSQKLHLPFEAGGLCDCKIPRWNFVVKGANNYTWITNEKC
jgi:carbamoylphosphate synthase large subunit